VTDTDLPEDPTAFHPLSVVACSETQIGYEVSPVVKRMTLDKSRIYQGWPEVRNRHTDYQAAQASGLSEPNINGGQIAECFGELFMKFFGVGYLGGSLAISFLSFVALDDEITTRARVVDRVKDGNGLKLVLKLTAENQDGVVVAAGTASGLVS
jgi:hypothetical protein